MSLSQKQFSEFKKVCEEFNQVEEIIEEELVHEICDELVEELVTEGYSEEDAIVIVEDAANDYIDEAKVTFGSDTAPMRKSGTPVGARRRFAMRKAGAALKGAASKAGTAAKGAMAKAKSKAAGAAVDASLAASSAKKAVSGAASAVKSAPGKAAKAAARGTERVEKKVKSGIKGMIGRAAKKVASKAAGVAKRMSEEVEALKASGKFSDKEIEALMAIDENRRAARAAGGYKDDSKKQTDPSKAGFTGISGSIKDIMRQNKEIEARNKKK